MAKFYTYRFNAVDIASKIPSGTGVNILAVSALRAIYVSIVTASEVTSNEKDQLDQFMSDRGYSFRRAVDTEAIFYTNTPVGEGVVPSGTAWSTIKRVVTNPCFFAANPAKMFARLIGRIKSPGNDAEIRIVEQAQDDSEVVVGQWTVPNTSDAWQFIQMITTVPPRVGDNLYRIECRGNTTSGAEIDAMSLTLLEAPV